MTITLYHYTTEEGYKGIRSSGKLIPSYRYNNLDTAHGEGHYFTNKPPTTYDDDLFDLWGNKLPNRVRAYVAFLIDDSLVQWCRDGVYRLPLGTVLEHSLNISTTYTDQARTKILIKFVDHGFRNNKPKPRVDVGDIIGGVALTVGAIGILSIIFEGKS